MNRKGVHIKTICNCISMMESGEFINGLVDKKVRKAFKEAHINDIEYFEKCDHYFLTNGSVIFPMYKETVFDIGCYYIMDRMRAEESE